ncbi:MAG: hypothetical protein Alpg2KO_28800 [Alphaproteobacteria bacterium]
MFMTDPVENPKPDDKKRKTRLVRKDEVARNRLSTILHGKVSVQSVVKGGIDATAEVGRFAARRSGLSGPCIGPLKSLVRLWRAPEARHAIYNRSGDLLVASRDGDPLQAAASERITLDEADLKGIAVKSMEMSSLKARNADLSWTSLKLVDLSRAKLSGASFKRARLRGVDFNYADLSGADFRKASFGNATKVWKERRYKYISSNEMITHSKQVGTTMNGANLDGALFSVDADFKYLNLSHEQRSQIKLVDSRGYVVEGARVTDKGEVLFTDFAPAKADKDTPSLPAP